MYYYLLFLLRRERNSAKLYSVSELDTHICLALVAHRWVQPELAFLPNSLAFALPIAQCVRTFTQ